MKTYGDEKVSKEKTKEELKKENKKESPSKTKDNSKEARKEKTNIKTPKENQNLKETMNEEEEKVKINKYLKSKHIVPSFLKYKNDGEIEIIDLISEGLKDIDKDNIEIEKVNFYRNDEKENKENLEEESTNNFSVSIFYFKSRFNSSKKNTNEITKKTICKTNKIYSFKIKDEEHLSLRDPYLRDLELISQSSGNDVKKAKDLEKLFKDRGYFIPKKVYIGGKYQSSKKEITNDNEKEQKFSGELKCPKFETNPEISNSNNKKKISKEDNLVIIGGNTNLNDINEWRSSVNLGNAEPIEVDEIIPVTKLINKTKYKQKLKGPLEIMNSYTELWEYYLNIISTVKKIDLPNEGNGTYSSLGSLNQSIIESPFVDCICFFFIEGVRPFSFAEKNIKENFNDTIIGIKIIDTKTTIFSNGDWKIDDKFLGKKKFHLYFKAKFFRNVTYFVIIYLIKKPEIGIIHENRNKFDLKLNDKTVGNMKDHDIEYIIEDYFKKNEESTILEKILQGKSDIKISFNEKRQFNGKIETKYVEKESKDVLEVTKKKLKPVNSLKI